MLALGQDVQTVTFGLIAIAMSIATMDRNRIGRDETEAFAQ